jgi:hypothetical protein
MRTSQALHLTTHTNWINSDREDLSYLLDNYTEHVTQTARRGLLTRGSLPRATSSSGSARGDPPDEKPL